MVFSLPIAVCGVFVAIVAVGIAPMFWQWQNKYLDTFISFGAGVLLSAAFIHMLPNSAMVLQEKAGLCLLAGFFLIFCVENYVLGHHSAEAHLHHIGYP